MASEFNTATMTVTITTALTLDGEDRGSSVSQTIASIVAHDRRMVPVPTSEVILLAFGAAVAAGTYVVADVRFILIANRDDTNHVTLVFRNSDSDEFAVKVDAGNFILLFGDNSDGVASLIDADSSALTVSLADLTDITALADTAECILELIVAGV